MGVPMAWLRGRSPKMKLTEFQARWCHRGVLCRAPSDRVLSRSGRLRTPYPSPPRALAKLHAAAGALPAAGATAAAAAGRRSLASFVFG